MTPAVFAFIGGLIAGMVLTIWLAIAPLERRARENDDA